MALTYAPAFGEFVFGSNHVLITDLSAPLDVRGAVAAVPRSDRSRARAGWLGPRQIVIEGAIADAAALTTRALFEEAKNDFLRAHRPGLRALYQYNERFILAECRAVTWGPDRGLTTQLCTARYEAPDPYWIASTPTPDLWETPTTGQTRPITNAGTEDALPIFTIAIAGTGYLDLTLTTDTGEWFDLDGAVTAGDILIVDCWAQTVTLNAASKMSYFLGSFFALAPGLNTLTLTLAIGGSGATLTSIATSFRARWL
jgi:hypothetical protein